MDFLGKITGLVHNLDNNQFKKALLIGLLAVSCIVGGLVYSISQKNNALIDRLKTLQTLTEKSFRIIEDNRKMVKEEQRLKEILEQNKDFTMKGFFENFCRNQEIIAEAGWDTRTDEVNEKFDEITLPAMFKDLTTEKITKILDALDKKEIVYIKELTLHKNDSGKINCDIIMATKKYKSFSD